MKPISLNGMWRYLPVAADDTDDYSSPTADVRQWDSMMLPQNWALAGLEHNGVVWFRRTFEMPKNDDCVVWWLEFCGVDYACDVWVNGRYIGSHTGYFERFRFEVTNAVVLETNTLVVRVRSDDDPSAIKGFFQHSQAPDPFLLESRLSNTGGIWGDVLLMPYDCSQPPQADDWFAPLAAPVLRYDPQQQVWRDGETTVFVRGCTYTPTRSLSLMKGKHFERDLKLVRDANLNALWVFHHILPQEFYTLCDQMGVYVWQDFPLPDLEAEPSAEFEAEALRQAEAMVRQLGQHPCIAAWCVDASTPLGERITARLRQLDPLRYVQTDGVGSSLHFETGAELAGLVQHFDHPLPHLHARPSLPPLPTLLESFPDEGAARASELVRHFAQSDEQTLEGVIEASQDIQARLIKHAVEYFRCQKGRGVTGVFYDTLVDHSAAASHSLLDHRRQPKSSYWSLRLAMQPILPIAAVPLDYVPAFPVGEAISFPVFIVNDLPERLMGWTCKISMTGWIPATDTDTGLTYMHHWSKTFTHLLVEGCSVLDLGEVTIPALPDQLSLEYHLLVQLYDLNDENRDAVVNTYVFRVRR